MRGMLAAIIAAVLVLTAAGMSRAQNTANASATATVMTALSVTASNNLLFGNVLQGVPKTIGNDDNDSTAQFAITGQASAGINLTLSLPEYLTKADGSARLTILFSTTGVVVDTTVATPATAGAANGWINQNPYSLPTAAVIGSGGQTNVYLGGKVVPSAAQSAGTYSGDIILSVAYNGS